MRVSSRAALVLAVALASCASPAKRAPASTPLSAMPGKRLASYAYDLSAPVPARVRIAPPALLDYLRAMDNKPGYGPYQVGAADLALFAEYYALLPEPFQRAMAESLVGIYFVEGFLGGGMLDFVLADSGGAHPILVLNPEILRAPLGRWIEYRDESSFAADPGLELKNGLGDGHRALLHTLLHEAGHLYDFRVGVTPFVEPGLARDARRPSGAAFTRGVWKEYGRPSRRWDFPGRSDAVCYGLGAGLPAGRAAAVYIALGRTPFSSLYGSASWAEDFAETFAWGWIRERVGLSYEVIVSQGGKEVAAFRPMESAAVKARYAALRELIR